MSQPTTVFVWDPLVRLFHWSLVTSFAIAYVSGEEWLTVHVYAGYLVGGLILFRLFWGTVGTRHARFGDFVRGPRAVGRYLGELLRGRAPRYLGHNPAGGAMILLLLVALVLTTVSGLAVYATAENAGPLAGLVPASHFWHEAFEESHEVLANLTVVMVVVHIAGVVVSSRLHRENLVRAMITGRKAREV